jgi:hypothetical protein
MMVPCVGGRGPATPFGIPRERERGPVATFIEVRAQDVPQTWVEENPTAALSSGAPWRFLVRPGA